MNVNVTPIWSSWAFCRCTSSSRNVTGLIMDSERQNASESGPRRCLRITLPRRRWRLDTPRTLQVFSTGGVSLLVRCHSSLFTMPGSCFWFALTENCILTSHESQHTHTNTQLRTRTHKYRLIFHTVTPSLNSTQSWTNYFLLYQHFQSSKRGRKKKNNTPLGDTHTQTHSTHVLPPFSITQPSPCLTLPKSLEVAKCGHACLASWTDCAREGNKTQMYTNTGWCQLRDS